MTDESRLNEIELHLQNLSRDLRLKRRNLKTQRERARRPFTKYQTEFALRVYCLSHYNMDAATTCLHNLCQRRQEHLSEVGQRQELIESISDGLPIGSRGNERLGNDTREHMCPLCIKDIFGIYGDEVGADGECDARPRPFHRHGSGI